VNSAATAGSSTEPVTISNRVRRPASAFLKRETPSDTFLSLMTFPIPPVKLLRQVKVVEIDQYLQNFYRGLLSGERPACAYLLSSGLCIDSASRSNLQHPTLSGAQQTRQSDQDDLPLQVPTIGDTAPRDPRRP